MNPFNFFIIFILLNLTINAQEQLASQGELYTGPEYRNSLSNPTDREDVPNVLIIGDSISIGYTVPVRKLLADKADVFRIPTNAKHSSFGLKNIASWVGNKQWDVIHFNWGLWDICYRNPKSKNQGHRDKEKGVLTTTPEKYKENIKSIVDILKKTNAKLIWCSTTPVPENELGRKVGDEILYNKIASLIMQKEKIKINNLHDHAKKRFDEFKIKKGDVHFSKEGYHYLAEKVALSIASNLPKS